MRQAYGIAVVLQRRMWPEVHAQDPGLTAELRVPHLMWTVVPARHNVPHKPVAEGERNLGVLVAVVTERAAQVAADRGDRTRARCSGGEHGDGQRMNTEVEQRTTTPCIGGEVAPRWECLQRADVEVIERTEFGNHAQHGGNRWRVGKVLGVEDALAMCPRRGDERVGIRKRGAQRLFDHDSDASAEHTQRVRGVQLWGSGDHDDVRAHRQLFVADRCRLHLRGSLVRSLGRSRRNGDDRHLQKPCCGTMRPRDHSSATECDLWPRHLDYFPLSSATTGANESTSPALTLM